MAKKREFAIEGYLIIGKEDNRSENDIKKDIQAALKEYDFNELEELDLHKIENDDDEIPEEEDNEDEEYNEEDNDK